LAAQNAILAGSQKGFDTSGKSPAYPYRRKNLSPRPKTGRGLFQSGGRSVVRQGYYWTGNLPSGAHLRDTLTPGLLLCAAAFLPSLAPRWGQGKWQ
jgi:hypothetical protein